MYGRISIADMMISSAQAQYAGVCNSYTVPNTRAMLKQANNFVDLSLSKKPKQTFISEIFDNAAKPNGQKPGPSTYNAHEAYKYATQNGTRKFKWDTAKRINFADEIIAREKNLKGPADYVDQQKKKIEGYYDTRGPKQAMMSEIHFKSSQTPSSNHYTVSTAGIEKQSPRADLNRDRSPKKALVPVVKNYSPSPTSYKDVDENWKKMSSYRNTNYKFSITKAKKTSFFEKIAKEKMKVPGTGQYKDDMEKFLKLSVSPTMSKYKRGR